MQAAVEAADHLAFKVEECEAYREDAFRLQDRVEGLRAEDTGGEL